MRLKLDRLWTDSDDGMIEVAFSMQAGGFAAEQQGYLYPDRLREFARALQAFPEALTDEVVLELGSPEPGHSSWVKLRAYVYDGTGHCALEFSVVRNGARQVQAASRFSAIAEAATLNELGVQLFGWAGSGESPLEFEARSE